MRAECCMNRTVLNHNSNLEFFHLFQVHTESLFYLPLVPGPHREFISHLFQVHMAITTRMSGDKFFLSNIHTINCTWSAADPSTWKFVRNNGSWFYPKVICRIESSDANLGLLLEVFSVSTFLVYIVQRIVHT